MIPEELIHPRVSNTRYLDLPVIIFFLFCGGFALFLSAIVHKYHNASLERLEEQNKEEIKQNKLIIQQTKEIIQQNKDMSDFLKQHLNS